MQVGEGKILVVNTAEAMAREVVKVVCVQLELSRLEESCLGIGLD